MAGKLGLGLLETLLENLDRDLNLANTTLTNPIITTSAAVTLTGDVTSTKLVHSVGVDVAQAAAGAGNFTSTFTQPANSVLTKCYIVCTDAPTVGTGDIGYDVGTSAAGGQIIAAQADEILDGGTTVVVGAVTYPGLALSLPAGDSAAQAQVAIAATHVGGFVYDVQDDTTHVASAAYTSAARTVHCTITTSSTTSDAGVFRFVFELLQLA